MLRTVVLNSFLNPTRFDVTMAVEIRIHVFWSMTPFLHPSGYWHFKDTNCLQLHGRREPKMDVSMLQKVGLW